MTDATRISSIEESPLVSTSTLNPSISSSTIRFDSDGCDGSREMHGMSRIRWARRWITCIVLVATPRSSASDATSCSSPTRTIHSSWKNRISR